MKERRWLCRLASPRLTNDLRYPIHICLQNVNDLQVQKGTQGCQNTLRQHTRTHTRTHVHMHTLAHRHTVYYSHTEVKFFLKKMLLSYNRALNFQERLARVEYKVFLSLLLRFSLFFRIPCCHFLVILSLSQPAFKLFCLFPLPVSLLHHHRRHTPTTSAGVGLSN